MRVLVTGGAGYIGSVVTRQVLAAGHQAVVFDNLVTGHREAVPAGVPFVEADTRDGAAVRGCLRDYGVEAVVHMAAISQVGTSVVQPRLYFENNVQGGLSLFNAMVDEGVLRLVFSSTAAVYGEPEVVPVDESAPTLPTSPYGDTKLFLETVLRRYGTAYGMKSASLRYFNAAGAHPEAGEDHQPETHLVPLVLEAALGRGPGLRVFGTDYPTPDGTAVRDYLHVLDLAAAHLLALDATADRSVTYNLGSGTGFSVKEVIEAARRVTGRAIPVALAPRRAGDPAVLVASSRRIRAELGWSPQFDDIEVIIESAWRWARRRA